MLDPGDIEGSQRSIEVKTQAVGISGLAVGETGKLLGVSEDKFDLEAGSIITVDGLRLQVEIGRKEEGMPRLFRVLGIPHDDDAQGAFEGDMVQHLGIEFDPFLAGNKREAR